MHAIRSAETGEITTSVDFETIKEKLIEEYTDMIEAIGIVEFITAHEKAIAEAKGEELNEKDLEKAILTNTVYPLILNLPESEKPLLMKIKYDYLVETTYIDKKGRKITLDDSQLPPLTSSATKIIYKSDYVLDSITIEEIGGE